jgi:hypothetical protein
LSGRDGGPSLSGFAMRDVRILYESVTRERSRGMKDEEMLEETPEIEQGEHGVHPWILVLYAVLIVICVVYFFTHLVRPI